MKKLSLTLLLLLFAAVCVAQNSGQGMTPEYSSYATDAVDDNNQGIIYQTVVVDGTTQGSCYITNPCGPNGQTCTITIQSCVTAVHTPNICNTITSQYNGSAGGCTTGPSQNPFAYMSYTTTTSLQLLSDDTVSMDNTWSVVCSAIGAVGSGSDSRPPLAHCLGELQSGPDGTGTCFYLATCTTSATSYTEIQDYTLSLFRSHPNKICQQVTTNCPHEITSWEINIGPISKHTLSACADNGTVH